METITNSWPQDTSIEAFRRTWILEGEPLWQRVFAVHHERMQIKNGKTALRNLQKIFTCTFRLANSQGFHSMSLRDLSRETQISMGGLYAYIGSKSDLASAIEAVVRQTIDDVMSDLEQHKLDPYHRLKAVINADLYMNDIMHPWYYFCFIEAKGLDKAQREAATRMELKFDQRLQEIFRDGIESGVFHHDGNLALLASSTTAMLQQWYLKRWKFQHLKVSIADYAAFVFQHVLGSLNCAAQAEEDSSLRSQA
ncbi:MAG: TetR/AcrR family transcriptional regulator [Pseudohongiella sp.]|uniref:TetR/AcrR family transcriptional regulator n=1 Tax=Pseudohongiella sp. TaxID=1979412 RepID=UPI00349FEACD